MGDDTFSPPADAASTGETTADDRSRRTMLASRAFVTWAELVVVGFAGSALGGATSGPPQLVVYLATTLVSVAVLLYNVDRLVEART
jgi:hypothetical protein